MASPHLLIIEARFYDDLADELLKGATQALERANASHERVSVPGCLEIPAALAMAIAATGRAAPATTASSFSAVSSAARPSTSTSSPPNRLAPIMDLAVAHRLAVGNGILTVENDDQAWVRARVGDLNKGGAAAEAALAMIALRQKFAGVAMRSHPKPANQRGAARLAAVQALYQMELAGATLPEVLAEFESYRLGKEIDGNQYRDADAAFFREIVAGVVRDQRQLDPAIHGALVAGLAAAAHRRDACGRSCAPAPTSWRTGRTCRRGW